ncbi:hypothetical protein ACFFRR_003393 [Megaselia abdita]
MALKFVSVIALAALAFGGEIAVEHPLNHHAVYATVAPVHHQPSVLKSYAPVVKQVHYAQPTVVKTYAQPAPVHYEHQPTVVKTYAQPAPVHYEHQPAVVKTYAQPAPVHYEHQPTIVKTYPQPAPVQYTAQPVHYEHQPTVVKTAPVYAHPVKHVEYETPIKYDFNYGVNDPHTGDIKEQTETRDGHNVQGSYMVVDPDGFKRIVEYTADEHNGFNAVVRREPIADFKPYAPAVKVVQPAHYAQEPQYTKYVQPKVFTPATYEKVVSHGQEANYAAAYATAVAPTAYTKVVSPTPLYHH